MNKKNNDTSAKGLRVSVDTIEKLKIVGAVKRCTYNTTINDLINAEIERLRAVGEL